MAGEKGGPLSPQPDDRLRTQIAAWRNELVNLTRRSRLLYFRHGTGSLEVVDPSPAAIAGELNAGREWYFRTEDSDPVSGTRSTAEELSEDLDEDSALEVPSVGPTVPSLSVAGKTHAEMLRSLSTLSRTANQTFLDKGIWSMYLALGFLNWVDPGDDSPAESPLLLVPVTLERESRHEPFRMARADADVSINPALAVKLSADFGIDLPGVEEVDEADPDGLFNSVRRLVAKEKGWTVADRAAVTLFSFYKEVMYRDLLDHEDDLVDHPLIQAVGLGLAAPDRDAFAFDPIPEDELDEKAPAEGMVNVLDADSSQRRCIAAARAGHSFVMDGPPGTGKSQTITNIIAETLRADRSVLFVSEKAAALDVVYDRLTRAGLAPFVLQMHSQNATRKAIAHELGRALKERPYAATGGMAEERVAVLRRDRRMLSAYAKAMNEIRRPLGRSLHDVLGTLSSLGDVTHARPAPISIESLSVEAHLDVVAAAEALARAWGPAELGEEFLWRELTPALSGAAIVDAGRAVEQAKEALEHLRATAASILDVLALPPISGTNAAEQVVRVTAALEERPEIPTAALTSSSMAEIQERLGSVRTKCAEYQASARWLSENIGPSWADILPTTIDDWDNGMGLLREETRAYHLPPQFAAGSILAAAECLTDGQAKLHDLRADTLELAGVLGIDVAEPTLLQTERIAAIAGLARRPHLPPPQWMNVVVIPKVSQALDVLEPLVEEWRTYRAQLASTFKEEALTADLAGLSARFERMHHGLGRLKSQYRQDKAAVASLTMAGVADKDSIGKLPAAVAWQDCHTRLAAAVEAHAAILGDLYLRERTDFLAVREALEVARNLIDLVDSPTDSTVAQLSAQGTPDRRLVPLSDRIVQVLGEWRHSFLETLRELPELRLGIAICDLAAWSERTSAALRMIHAAVTAVDQASGSSQTVEQVDLRVAQVKEADRSLTAIDAAAQEVVPIIGATWAGWLTDWDIVDRNLDWARRMRDLLGGHPVPPRTAERLLSAPVRSSEIIDVLEAWHKAEGAVAQYFTPTRWEEISQELEASFRDGSELLDELAETTGQIDEWYAYAEAADSLRQAGLDALFQFCVENRVPRDELTRVVDRSVLEGWALEVFALDKDRLGKLRASDRDALVSEFSELDEELVRLSAAEVIDVCTKRRPESRVGAAGIIAREAEKQKRHMPTRLLIEQTGPLVQRLKPCFMMSPLSVSQFLPSDFVFDLVIFDEASQVRPADAVNCIYRGRQLIVAGDKKQLPPTNFFQVGTGGDEDLYQEDQLEEYDSILESCKASGCIESMSLRWHYRSEHESLITYSNYRFYDGDLLTFPGAIQDSDSLGVKYFKVEGIYRRGSTRDNPIEAKVVVDRVLHHRRNNPDLSLGVVAFSGAQEDAILAELERRAESEPDLQDIVSDDRLNGFFIKNLENVQGDEREIIIFSIGYGPDEMGKFYLNLGPITRRGGWRRLNVAITRAKRLVEVVSSITPEDISTEAGSEGVRHLRGYLDFARRGIAALALDLTDSHGDAESPFEEEVLRRIRSWGYDAVPQVGVAGYRIDIGVHHPTRPGEYILGVECDGATYHSSKVARDRDRLRQTVLERLGWKLHRIWGPSWYRERQEQEDRLKLTLDDAVNPNRAPKPVTKPDRPEPPQLIVEDADLTATPSWAVPYTTAPPDLCRANAYELHEPGARLEIRRLVKKIVGVEQPVHHDVVLRYVLAAWDRQRAGSRIRENFDYAIQELVGAVETLEPGFLAEPGYRLEHVRIPTGTADVRPLKHVSWAELRLAIENVILDCRTIDRDELATYVSRLFGWQRTGSEIENAVQVAADDLIDGGRIRPLDERHLTVPLP